MTLGLVAAERQLELVDKQLGAAQRVVEVAFARVHQVAPGGKVVRRLGFVKQGRELDPETFVPGGVA